MQLADLFTPQARNVTPPMYGPPRQAGDTLISLAYGLADPELLPHEELLEAAAELLGSELDAALNYGPSSPELLALIANRLRREGVAAREEQVLVGYGSSQILGLLPYVLLEPHDVVVVEAPTFSGAVTRFKMAGAQLVGVPVDAHGVDVDILEQTLRDLRRQGKRVKFIYTIPTFHNPTGTTLSLERRQKLAALAAEHGVLVVEDDAYVDLRFRGEPLPSLAALDEAGWVLRVGTFSKILAPGLRMGWAHGPKPLIERLQMFKVEGGSGPFLTRLVARFCAEGRLDQHIQALSAHYSAKCDATLAAIARYMPGVVAQRPDGGFFVWLRLPDRVQASVLQAAAIRHGAEALPGSRCFVDGSGEEYLRIAFSHVPVAQIEEAIRRIGQALDELRAGA